MDVAIIGSGEMARGLAGRLAPAARSVTVYGRTTRSAESLVAGLAREDHTVRAATLGDPVTADLLVLAVPFAASPAIIAQYGEHLPGRVLVDVSNPDRGLPGPGGFPEPGPASAAEELAGLVPAGTVVVKAFNTVTAGALLGPGTVDVFVATDDEQARVDLFTLVRAAGMLPLNAGGLRGARELEGMGRLHLVVRRALGTAAHSSFALRMVG
ncbi:NADPH-dependent F420 reductase [Actinoalloteichus spitiensis]|uniref:NADPH-dependent F420 reductase n=1 Tax=Actinoalloteichus spitiensis TaxID=252394 RepID=UPI000373AB2A|nr:NAD(P)-binding domain-containing protein [Actinoalloteichus spitiensis]